MLNNKQLDLLPSYMVERIDELNRYVMKKIGGRIKGIGKLKANEAKFLSGLSALDAGLNDIERASDAMTKKNLNEIDEIFDIAREKHHDFTSKYFAKRGIDSSDLSFLSDYVDSVKQATKEQYLSVSKTIGFNIDGTHKSLQKAYQEAIEKALTLVSSGEKNYKSAIRDTIRKLGESGLKAVEYRSGTVKSLENAVKINIADRVREVNAGMSKRAGEKFGSDGVEISVHPNSAPDHEDIQGRQFTHEEFNKLQNQQPFKDITGKYFAAIKRPIGMWNCGHYTFEIIIGASQPVYDEERLQRYKFKNAKGFTYEGEKYTGYEADQMQDRIKFEWRKARGAFTIAESAGDMELANSYRYRMTLLENDYIKFSRAMEEFYRKPSSDFPNVAENPDSKKIIIPPRSPLIDELEYRDKFEHLEYPDNIKTVIKNEARRDIKLNDRMPTERVSIINIKNSKDVKNITLGAYGGFVQDSEFDKCAKGSIILVHNHPNSTSFSDDDINLLNGIPQIDTIIAAGHDGTVYTLSINEQDGGKRLDNSVFEEYNKLKIEYDNDLDNVLKKLSKIYGWRYKKI